MSDAVQFVFRFFLFVLVHSLFAIPLLKERVVERNRHLRRFYRLYYNVASLVVFGWVMSVFRNSTVLYVVPGVWSLVMHAMQVIFFIVLIGCVRQTGIAEFLGVNQVTHDGVQTPRLVTDGGYRVVRHPLYLFSILIFFCNPVISVRWLLLSVLSTVYFLAGACLEERRLLKEFGNEYLIYQRMVPFILPRLFPR
jgi:protein-S-isoprenylcysteine O-methyltransferase Ste14